MQQTQAGAVRPRLYLKSILVTAALLRLAVVWFVVARYPKGWFFRSQGELGFLAQSLLSGHGLASPFGGSTGPTAFLAPGYPVLVAAVFSGFGSFTPAAAAAIMLLQTLFGVLTVLLIVRISDRAFGALAANIAGGFWAAGIPFLYLPVIFWDCSLSILLLLGAMALSLRCIREPGAGVWAAMGVYGSLTLLINPSLSLTLLGLFTWCTFQTVYKARSTSLLQPLTAALLCALLFAPWPVRNARQLHAFIPLRSNLGFELWKGNRPGATSVDDTALYPVFNRQEYADYATMGEVGYMRHKTALAREYIQTHPRTFVRLSAERFVRYWTGTGSSNPVPLLALHTSATTVLGLLGLIWLFKDRRIEVVVVFLLPLLLFPLPYYITHAELRFRILIEPVTTILAAYAISRWIESRSDPPRVAEA